MLASCASTSRTSCTDRHYFLLGLAGISILVKFQRRAARKREADVAAAAASKQTLQPRCGEQPCLRQALAIVKSSNIVPQCTCIDQKFQHAVDPDGFRSEQCAVQELSSGSNMPLISMHTLFDDVSKHGDSRTNNDLAFSVLNMRRGAGWRLMYLIGKERVMRYAYASLPRMTLRHFSRIRRLKTWRTPIRTKAHQPQANLFDHKHSR
jgi:hypothetical protein